MPIDVTIPVDKNDLAFLKRSADRSQSADTSASNDIVQFISGLAVTANLLVRWYFYMVKSVHNVRA